MALKLKAWGPMVPRPPAPDAARTVAGAAFGIAMAALIVYLDARFAPEFALHLFAPLGATAVLVFAVPTSPLAQPFSCIVGNTVSALWTVLVLHMLPPDWWAPVAVGGAIACMLATRSLHPPGGAVAMLMALSAPVMLATPWWLLLLQIGFMTAVLVFAGVVYHRATGRRYPHHADLPTPGAAPGTPPPARHGSRLGLSTADLEALLLRFDQANNLDAEDLAELIVAAEDAAIERRLGGVHCGQLMSPHPVSCQLHEPLGAIADRFQAHRVKSLPVVDAQGRLLGLLERSALFEALWALAPTDPAQALPAPAGTPPENASPLAAARRRWRWFRPQAPDHAQRIERNAGDRHETAGAGGRTPLAQTALLHHGALVLPSALTVDPETPVGQLLDTLASHQVPCVPVLRQGLLVGVITRTDLMRLLLQPAAAPVPVPLAVSAGQAA
ncbi:hypothetical protein CCO03_08980 [Comamonas serinivorans]|uniref:CBS domain-containing protein n=1 Tax=Comamonas serinivorans TaxID=1082851 RepID=A0A1Y0ETU7_9BURK|nr:HPP family protein [Comamonas serinivorans]ARU06749.1 hypothetical protein CCO03_08980 [Comamonas serinivorans]